MGNVLSTITFAEIINSFYPTSGIHQLSENTGSTLTLQDILDHQGDAKCADMSRYYLDEGHYYLTSDSTKNEPILAVEKYTQSIMYAPVDSVELNLAFAGRSVALFNARFISDSLINILQVTLVNYPNELKSELLYGEAMCYQILFPRNLKLITETFDKAEKWIPHMHPSSQEKMTKKIRDRQRATIIDRSEVVEKVDPEMIAPEWEFNSSNFHPVTSRYTRSYGHYFETTRDVKKNEIIAIQTHKPYIKIISLKNVSEYCWYCAKKSWSTLPCYHCPRVVFCSDDCRTNAWNEYHSVECQIMMVINKLGTGNEDDDYCIQGAIKLTLKALKETQYSIKTLKDIIDRIYDDDNDPEISLLDPGRYSTVFILSSHVDESNDMRKYSQIFSKIVALLETRTDLFDRDDNGLSESERNLFLMSLIRINFAISKNNGIFFGKDSNRLYMLVPVINKLIGNSWKMSEQTVRDSSIGIVTLREIPAGKKVQIHTDCIAKFSHVSPGRRNY